MSNRLKTLVALIQAITNQTVEDVARSINYTRPHLTTEMGKKDGNPGMIKQLQERYHKEIENFFRDKDVFIADGDYDKTKIVDADQQIVHDILIVKGMLRVVLRNQGAVIAAQKKVSLSSVLKDISAAVKAETKGELDSI